MTKTSACKKCGRRYKVLTNDELCYKCHIEKYGEPPSSGVYKQEKTEKK